MVLIPVNSAQPTREGVWVFACTMLPLTVCKFPHSFRTIAAIASYLEPGVNIVDHSIEPLHWPEGFAHRGELPKRSYFSKRSSMETAAIENVKQQLLSRERPNAFRWGNDGDRIRVGQLICKIVKEEYKWPNDYFVPLDPVDIVLLVPWDDLEYVEVFMALERELGIELENQAMFDVCGKSLGDFVDLVVAKMPI